jgi:hypothetical protein
MFVQVSPAKRPAQFNCCFWVHLDWQVWFYSVACRALDKVALVTACRINFCSRSSQSGLLHSSRPGQGSSAKQPAELHSWRYRSSANGWQSVTRGSELSQSQGWLCHSPRSLTFGVAGSYSIKVATGLCRRPAELDIQQCVQSAIVDNSPAKRLQSSTEWPAELDSAMHSIKAWTRWLCRTACRDLLSL